MIVGDERVAETFTAPGDEIERLMYGFSILHCLPASRTETPSAATGTVLRPATLRAYATEAGFGDVQILPIENEMWRRRCCREHPRCRSFTMFMEELSDNRGLTTAVAVGHGDRRSRCRRYQPHRRPRPRHRLHPGADRQPR